MPTLKTMIGVAGIAALLTASLFVVFTWGNPQWSKYIYIWQAYYFPADGSLISEHGMFFPPKNYTGEYTVWYDNGQMGGSGMVTNGVPNPNTWVMYTRDGVAYPAIKPDE